MVQRLRDQDSKVTPALLWLDQRLRAQNTTADEEVRSVHQGQGATNVTVRNVITSMRLMSAVDWAEFFESVSTVDAVLRAGSDFAAMDFATRDRYRHAIEKLARGSVHTEIEVAQHAMSAASRAAPEGPNRDGATARRERDPGYYLISRGLPLVEQELGFRAPIRDWIARANKSAGISGYLATIALVTALILAIAIFATAQTQLSSIILLLLMIVGVIPALDVAVTIVNRAVTLCIGPATIAALELRGGVPTNLRTMIVMPTLLTTQSEIEEQAERLEVHYLASPDGDLRFALLSDWRDCTDENAPGDDLLLGAASSAIARLNQRHGPGPDGDRFLLLHRRRVWDEAEGKWMGWERKRGKLHELNQLLRGATDTSFVGSDGHPPTVPAAVRFVITLDADTRLPRGAAKGLVGKMAHPLNAPRFDAGSGRVVEGYGVLQPRVTPSLPTGREGSIFQRVFSSASGIDPYAFAVSDVYQDLLGEGSYSGKGIYDVDVFEAALSGRVPDNTLLSHDLFEGTFARSGLASDLEVVEEFPARYDVAAARQHRWARGDWQLLPWILGRPHASFVSGHLAADDHRSDIPPLGRWKMIDNLRRTLLAPSAFIALMVGWTLPFSAALTWTGFVVATVAAAPMLPFITGLVPRRSGISKRSHLRAVAADLALGLAQIAIVLTLLAHQAWLMGDAIVRTLYRLFVSHRRMLEWVTAAQAKLATHLDLRGFYRSMAAGVALGAGAAILLALEHDRAGLLAAPFVIMWILAPAIARWASLPPPIAGMGPISDSDAQALRLTARRTWSFFEKFVTAEDNMLPPDNFQEDPKPVLAHRTSPTNLGLYLLSVVAAQDFGWIGTHESVERLAATLASMNRLELFRGHFYNWYATRDLRPLDPKYVSSVDSGNLAGHLITLGSACREMFNRPVVGPQRSAGMEDLVALIRESLAKLAADPRTHIVTPKQLREALDSLCIVLRSEPQTPAAIVTQMAELSLHADSVVDMAHALTQRSDSALPVWAESLRDCIGSHRREIELLMPWAILIARDPTAGNVKSESGPNAAPDDELKVLLDSVPTLAVLADRCEQASVVLSLRKADLEAKPDASGRSLDGIDAMLTALASSARAAKSLERQLIDIAALVGTMFDAMKFDFLFDSTRQLL
ncbi:MAG: glycosyl transferase, partial [Candidatus Binatus sp.]|nr:glycosyl transferase [Candidatus Binatus sp.]